MAITSGTDAAGHGTTVAGIAAGNGYSSSLTTTKGKTVRMFSGIAPEAKLINLRVLNGAADLDGGAG